MAYAISGCHPWREQSPLYTAPSRECAARKAYELLYQEWASDQPGNFPGMVLIEGTSTFRLDHPDWHEFSTWRLAKI